MADKEIKSDLALTETFSGPKGREFKTVEIVPEQQNVTREDFEKLKIKLSGNLTLVPSDEVRLDARTMRREKVERRILGLSSNLNIFSQKPN